MRQKERKTGYIDLAEFFEQPLAGFGGSSQICFDAEFQESISAGPANDCEPGFREDADIQSHCKQFLEKEPDAVAAGKDDPVVACGILKGLVCLFAVVGFDALDDLPVYDYTEMGIAIGMIAKEQDFGLL